MVRKKVFISSVQSEFAAERQMLYEYLSTDALLGIYFEPFIFENVPAANSIPSKVFLGGVENCDIYLGIYGKLYGHEDSEGVSPTEREFDLASLHNKVRLVYIKQAEDRERKEELLIKKAENAIVRKGFLTSEQLRTAVYASLVNYLIENEFIRTSPFDATYHPEATVADLNEEKIRDFADTANRKRGFPFDRRTDVIRVLTHLDLIKGNRVTNAALLLFSDRPQRYFITSEVRCAHFHGLRATKPIPSYQVYKGSVFEMIASAVDFVLSKINIYNGDRSKGIQVDVEYEIPIKAVTEAIVNAVTHRDYNSNASVQVMLFPDRLEVLNPGRLPFGLTIEKLYRAHKSIPANPLLAESLYLYGIIERMGTGTEDIVNACTEKGLKRPEFTQDSGFEAVLYRSSQVEYEAMHPTTQPTTQPANTSQSHGISNEPHESIGRQSAAKRSPSGRKRSQAVTITDRKGAVIAFLEEHNEAKTPELIDVVGLSDGRVRFLLREMVSDGTIEKIGDNRYTYYILKQQ
jgi:predicted HTH transcriptional regulator